MITWQLTGDTRKDHRLTWHIDDAASAALEEEIFGKHVLITDHDDWPVAEIIAAYRSHFVVAGGDGAVALEAVDAALHGVALLVPLGVEGGRTVS